jgi:dTDP-4-dehydrorhamnose reductase
MMKENKTLVLGYGLLGKELVKQTNWDYISRKKDGFDITNKDTYHLLTKVEFGAIQHCEYNTIINCIANTNTYSNDKQSHWDTNYKSTADLVDFCNRWKIKLVHISTDYVYSNSKPNASEDSVPVHCENWYGYTKLLGDGYVQLKSNDYLIIRCTHKPTPFVFDKAWVDQVGNFDYVDNISRLIIKLINKNSKGIYNVGTNLKSIFDLAKKTKTNVTSTLKPIHTPSNITMDLTKLNNKLNDK